MQRRRPWRGGAGRWLAGPPGRVSIRRQALPSNVGAGRGGGRGAAAATAAIDTASPAAAANGPHISQRSGQRRSATTAPAAPTVARNSAIIAGGGQGQLNCG
jgi:hypothetical protein